MEVLGYLYPSQEHLEWLADSSTQCLSSPNGNEDCGKFWASLAPGCLLTGIFLFFLAALGWWFGYPRHKQKHLFKLKSRDRRLQV